MRSFQKPLLTDLLTDINKLTRVLESVSAKSIKLDKRNPDEYLPKGLLEKATEDIKSAIRRIKLAKRELEKIEL